MNIALDVHTHTVASGHAYSSLQEMVAAARGKGLKILGIADHGPAIQQTCKDIYFTNFHVIPREIDGVKLLMGAEINILNTKGDFDLKESTIKTLDVRIAGIHSSCFSGGTKEENTKAVVHVIRNPLIDIISHPADGSAELDLDVIVQEARCNHILLEVNNSSLNPNRGKKKAWGNNRQMLNLCMKYGVKVIMGSDAHISYDVANYKYVFQLMEEVGFPAELVVNDKPEFFMEFLKQR